MKEMSSSRPTSRTKSASQQRPKPGQVTIPAVTIIYGAGKRALVNIDCYLRDFHAHCLQLSKRSNNEKVDVSSEKGMLTDIQSILSDENQKDARADEILKKGFAYYLLEVKPCDLKSLPSSTKKEGKGKISVVMPEDNILTPKLFALDSSNPPKDFTLYLSSAFKTKLQEAVKQAILKG